MNYYLSHCLFYLLWKRHRRLFRHLFRNNFRTEGGCIKRRGINKFNLSLKVVRSVRHFEKLGNEKNWGINNGKCWESKALTQSNRLSKLLFQFSPIIMYYNSENYKDTLNYFKTVLQTRKTSYRKIRGKQKTLGSTCPHQLIKRVLLRTFYTN